MPPVSSKPSPLTLVWSDDDFAVKQRARQLYKQWCEEVGGMDHEVIDAAVANSGEALRALARLREALQTLPFFGKGKVIWFQNCNFLGDERAAESQVVVAAVTELGEELKAFRWTDVRLLISAGKVDRRKSFYKTIEKVGVVENPSGLSLQDKGWTEQAEGFVLQELHARGKEIGEEALGELVSRVGPHLRQLAAEVEKLALYVGTRKEVAVADVKSVVSLGKHARAFALGDALGDRNLPRLLRALDEELWEMKTDKQKSVIGVLYGLISKVRTLLLVKEMLARKLIRPEASYPRFKTQFERLPDGEFGEDKRYNPLAMNSYVVFRALGQAPNYATDELVNAMDVLLTCNRRLVSSGLDEALVLQQALVQIVGPAESRSLGHSGTRAPG
jgi:DNA polymerase-3 subunit delta